MKYSLSLSPLTVSLLTSIFSPLSPCGCQVFVASSWTSVLDEPFSDRVRVSAASDQQVSEVLGLPPAVSSEQEA
ncbi:hypothetical protein SO3561_10518 [Streptomyces olivochromogenes]|uniref:Uncharacterized protein n=1 Tax=Streptomyces olivochromogenes TaxID=1963 RepID=A0A286PHB4_STROL|nr:hypothetical protein SO3561_10518 [Streptomyces olivochromogenes]